MKDNLGRPLSAIDTLCSALGEDWLWWLIPTRPEIQTNYFEKLYTLKQLKKMKGETPEDDEFDPNRKLIAIEKKIADFEKKIVMGVSVVCLTTWFLYARYQMQTWMIAG
jgi:hypothetical protein